MSDEFSAWIGRTEQASDRLDAARTNALCTALGEPASLSDGDALPLLHHWLYFWTVVEPDALGPDGHPARGGFLPPVPLPRRMWAGGRLTFIKPLLVGEHVTRVSTVLDVAEKSGRSGPLVFVTVKHELTGADGLALVEEQDIVYREAANSVPAMPLEGAGPASPWQRSINPDPVLLFRYSALTMNGHRIHYDRPYAMTEESYPALVVHGPLQATLLAGLATRHCQAPIKSFAFRGASPAFDGVALHVCGEPMPDGANLWTEQGGKRAMEATVVTG